jgi:hypothetical protein
MGKGKAAERTRRLSVPHRCRVIFWTANYFNVFAERELVHFMSKSSRDITKSSQKRAQATGEPVLVRVQPDMAKQLDDWRRAQDDLPGRPEAIRRLVELGLKAKK